MRLITFDKMGVETVGVRVGSDLVDLSIAEPKLPRTVLELIQRNMLKEAAEVAQKASANAHRSLEKLKYLPVIPKPPKFFGVGVNYPSHVLPLLGTQNEKNINGATPTKRPNTPGFFVSGADRLTGHNMPLHIPRANRTLDYEVELAFVFAKRAWHVKEKDALPYIAGYTVFNDGSVRGYGAGLTLVLMKGSDKTGPLGPEFVTPDELPLGCDGLTIELRRNGKVVQHDNTKNMYWKIPEIVDLISHHMTFNPGDVVTTGTCGGTVVDSNPGHELGDLSLPWLKPGEVIESELEGIGVLRNPIELEPESA
jgi:acylpyruvate hydrolase